MMLFDVWVYHKGKMMAATARKWIEYYVYLSSHT